jgi:hypothetical protein
VGESKQKAERYAQLLRDHPACCYCGGAKASETVDHAPARICFRQKVGPEGYELPACAECNRESSLSEMIAAFYIRMSDHEASHFHGPDIERLISAMANNAPHCLPDGRLSANDRRRSLREREMSLPKGQLLASAPIVRIPEGVQPHMGLFARKMLAALFYRETGGIIGPDHAVILQWAQLGTPAANFSRSCAEAWFGELRAGTRQNTSLGSQFTYKFGYHPAHGFFGLWMEFGLSFGFLAIAGPRAELAKLDDRAFVHSWTPIDALAREIKAQCGRS